MPRAVLTDEQVLELTKKSLERSILRRREEEYKSIKELYKKEQQEKQKCPAETTEVQTV